MPGLKYLVEKGIKFHTQVVVMPGLNDGRHLEKTVNDLYGLYPGVKTLGIVPVGLTKYRKHLPRLKPFNSPRADGLLGYIHSHQRRFLGECGSRFLFAADEFYILCGRKLPGISEYEDMEQFENGIGMMRHLLADFNRRKRWLKEIKVKNKKRIALLTGESAYDTLHDEVVSDLRRYGYEIDIYAAKNRFWGRYVTVSGLLTGRDLLAVVKKIKHGHDLMVLPPNCLNDDFLFLDDMSLEQFRKKAGIDVTLGTYSIIDTVKGIFR